MAILDLQRRMRELGRVRIGATTVGKDGKTRPTKLEVFRLTSPSEEILRHASGLYGGIPNEWADAPGEGTQYELLTETAEMDVYVVPQDIANQQSYELWSGGGCQRRCDGAVEQMSGRDCLCDPENRKCKPTTHLLVMLPQLPDVGVWRLVTHGWNAANELPGTVEMLRQVAGTGGMPAAVLAIEQRTSKTEGKTHHFSVPVLRVPWSLAQAQSAGVPVLGRPSMGEAPALPLEANFEKPVAASAPWGTSPVLPPQAAPMHTSGDDAGLVVEPPSSSGTTSAAKTSGLDGEAHVGEGATTDSPAPSAAPSERDDLWMSLLQLYGTETKARNALNRAIQGSYTAATVVKATAQEIAKAIEASER